MFLEVAAIDASINEVLQEGQSIGGRDHRKTRFAVELFFDARILLGNVVEALSVRKDVSHIGDRGKRLPRVAEVVMRSRSLRGVRRSDRTA